MPLPAWSTQKLGPLPVWGWGALSVAGGVGFVLYKRRQAASGAATLAGNAQAVPSTYPSMSGPASAGGGPGAGGFAPGGLPSADLTQLLNSLGSPSTSSGGATPVGPVAATPTAAYAPAVQISPSLLGGGYLASQNQLQNPVGSSSIAYNTWDPSTQRYVQGPATPSATALATEQPGGIQVVQAGLPGTEPSSGQTYTIYGTNTGSGPVVPAAQRVAGERYDATGRVIA